VEENFSKVAGFSRFRCLPIEESNIFSKILPFLPRFVAYHLEGLFILYAKFLKKVSNE